VFSVMPLLPAPHSREATVAQNTSLCYLTVSNRSVIVAPTS
jgi:hypothetical protein